MSKKRGFEQSLLENGASYAFYVQRMTELSISMFEWQNLPDTIDERFLELTLFEDGNAVFFYDEELGYLALQCISNGQLNVYRIPIGRRAYAVNGYSKDLNIDNSVIIYNNYIRTNTYPTARLYASRLYDLDRTISINARAQKTPILIQGTPQQRLSLLNLYKEYDGNQPAIFADKNLDFDALKVVETGAPYVCDKLYELKNNIWNEALTYLGISNIAISKKERLISDEVARTQGGTIASRYSRLEARRQACEKINDMFGLDIWVDYRADALDQIGSAAESGVFNYE